MKGFNADNFKYDIQAANWDELMNCDGGDIDYSLSNFLNNFNSILDKHAPLKKANKKEIKTQQKPWITQGILCSIKKKRHHF